MRHMTGGKTLPQSLVQILIVQVFMMDKALMEKE